jgi:anti-anti-sigma factor
MDITKRAENGITVFVLSGRIDTEGAAEVDAALQEAASSDEHKMVLDMAKVPYICSAGLRTLADVFTKNKRAGGDLKLAAMDEKVARILQTIGFDKFFAVYDTVKAVITDF